MFLGNRAEIYNGTLCTNCVAFEYECTYNEVPNRVSAVLEENYLETVLNLLIATDAE